MTTQVVLLRAVNVGGSGKVTMSALRDRLTALGHADVRTALQSGNVVMRTTGKGGPTLESELEAALLDGLGLGTDVVVRSAAEWAAVVAGNPFPDEATGDPSHLVALLAKRSPGAAAVAALRAAVTRARGREVVGVHGTQVYMTYPDGIGDSRVTPTLIERALGTPVTGRNWNTVLRLAAMAVG